MAYSSEVVRRARNRLAQAKEDRESENRQHLAEAYARVPRIREIDMLLRRTMAQAAQAAFLEGSDGRELLEQAAFPLLASDCHDRAGRPPQLREGRQMVTRSFGAACLDRMDDTAARLVEPCFGAP